MKRGYVFDGSGLWYRDKPLAQYAPLRRRRRLGALPPKNRPLEFRLTQEEFVPEPFRLLLDRFQIVVRKAQAAGGGWWW